MAEYRNVPNEYIQVTFIQSDELGYIDTGVTVSDDLLATATFNFLEIPKYGFETSVFGMKDTDGRFGAYIDDTNQIAVSNGTISQTNPYETVTVNVTPSVSGIDSDLTVLIFAQNETNAKVSYYGICRLYSMKMYDDSVLIRDFVPVVRKSDNKAGLYDVVNSVFYPEITGIPSTYQCVEYIESIGTGDSYIDTGYVPNVDTGMYATFNIMNELGPNNHGNVFGATETGATANRYYINTWAEETIRSPQFFRGDNYKGYPLFLVNNAKVTIGQTPSFIVRNDNGRVTVDTNDFPNITASCYLFSYNKGNSYSDSPTRMKLYHFVFFETTTDNILHEYIPVIRVSDDKPGLYDRVTDTFLVNGGADEFIYGSEKTGFGIGSFIYPSISKIKIGNTTYSLKDEVARTSTKNIEHRKILYFHNQPVSVAYHAEIIRINSPLITENTVVLDCVFDSEGFIRSDIEWTSYDGYIAFTGVCLNATTANVTLGV